jgi:hypothetical protein
MVDTVNPLRKLGIAFCFAHADPTEGFLIRIDLVGENRRRPEWLNGTAIESRSNHIRLNGMFNDV